MQPFEKPDPAHNPLLREPSPLRALGEPIALTDEEEQRIERLFTRYPTRQAVILPMLWLIQEKIGWIPEEAIALVAERCEVPPSHVHSVVSFYTMYNRAPVGRYHLQVCTNLSCQLMGAESLLDCLRRKLGIELKETTEDRLFTLDEVECLAACEMAPMIQVNEEFVGPLNGEEDVDRLLDRLRSEAKAAEAGG
ncbi:MAG: NADH-quinone oxidoreductase subunit NuoE [Candidatus Eisenbacteria bacterium]|nr:NADH-quinone oxidoreductase subunit NuoE [Candidatus Latescibacterota bacterium]MBD3303215.1 NADH-quinone oxidoreductase subunit NuoE [Candidatus Eisenbacteria bacterium]